MKDASVEGKFAMMKKMLLVIDVQNDFVDGSLGTEEAQAMLPRLLEKVRSSIRRILILIII